jgi:hypothetical protein
MTDRRDVVDFFIDATTAKFNRIDEIFDKLELSSEARHRDLMDEIDNLKKFKFLWTGGVIAINAAVTFAVLIFFGK